MKVYWWQGGVHIEPESQEEREALYFLTNKLNLVNLSHEIPAGPVGPIKGINQEPVVAVQDLAK